MPSIKVSDGNTYDSKSNVDGDGSRDDGSCAPRTRVAGYTKGVEAKCFRKVSSGDTERIPETLSGACICRAIPVELDAPQTVVKALAALVRRRAASGRKLRIIGRCCTAFLL